MVPWHLCKGALVGRGRSYTHIAPHAQAGPGTIRFLMFLFLITIIAVVFTIKKLVERWRNVSTDVFVSEV